MADISDSDTFAIWVEIIPLNVSSGSYITSYPVMTPFWSMSGTGPQVTMMEVEDNICVIIFTGALAGTAQK